MTTMEKEKIFFCSVKDSFYYFFTITVEDTLKKTPLFYSNFQNYFFSYTILYTFVLEIFAFFCTKFC